MKNYTIPLAIGFLALYFGYPEYQDYKYTKQMREHMQSEHVDIAGMKGLPIKGQFVNNYPSLEMRFKLTEVELADLPLPIKKKMRQEVKVIACRNLRTLEGKSRLYIKTKTKILEEDRVSIRIIVRGKAGKHITEHTQVISKCANFEDYKRHV